MKVVVRRQRGGVDAACVTSALVRTSGLRPSQSAQLSEAIIFLRFRSRNACAGRWCLSPAAHTGQPCEDTMRPATSEHTAQSARRRLCNIEHIGDGSIGGHGRKAARQREGKRRVANRRDWAIRKREQFGTEGLSKGLMAALKISFECSILYKLLLFSGRTLRNRAASRKATELSIQLSVFGSALLRERLQTVMSWFDQKPRWRSLW